jgi:SAM-dependent methyltransferase
MKQTYKSALRRARDPAFLQSYFSGVGIDIGAGSDPLSAYTHLFPKVRRVLAWDKEHGDAIHMNGVPAEAFDFVHASDCLEHLSNPAQALARWLEIIKPGGYLVLTVPDEDLYEKGVWPSQFNAEHEVSFTIHKPYRAMPASFNVLDLVSDAARIASCERIALIREHYDEEQPHLDQTLHGAAECAIEVVLRKRPAPSLATMLEAIQLAGSASEAVARCEDARALYPYRFETYHRANHELLRWNRTDALEALWAACVRRLPNEYLPRMYKALGLIALGKLNEGFQQREALWSVIPWQQRTTAQPPDCAAWKGESLQHRSIVIWSEFGLGDEIFFLRFARILREQSGAAQVSVVCQAPLVDLFRKSTAAATICSVDEAHTLAPHDYWVYPHDIPAWLSLDIDRLPNVVPYVRAPGEGSSFVMPGNRGALKVGVVFKGAPTHENDRSRSLPSLAILESLFALDDVEFYVLQKGQGEEQATEYAARFSNVHDLGPGLHTFSDTANAVDALDLLISVDTSIANLAGAMGKPVWLMLPRYGDWRWLFVREDSPWYPSARLFRQNGDGWPEVVERIHDALLRLRNSAA